MSAPQQIPCSVLADERREMLRQDALDILQAEKDERRIEIVRDLEATPADIIHGMTLEELRDFTTTMLEHYEPGDSAQFGYEAGMLVEKQIEIRADELMEDYYA